jgi:hypothetical protein
VGKCINSLVAVVPSSHPSRANKIYIYIYIQKPLCILGCSYVPCCCCCLQVMLILSYWSNAIAAGRLSPYTLNVLRYELSPRRVLPTTQGLWASLDEGIMLDDDPSLSALFADQQQQPGKTKGYVLHFLQLSVPVPGAGRGQQQQLQQQHGVGSKAVRGGPGRGRHVQLDVMPLLRALGVRMLSECVTKRVITQGTLPGKISRDDGSANDILAPD